MLFQNRTVYSYGSRGHRCLRRPVHVPHLGSRKALKQTSRGLRGECFTAKKKTANAWKHPFRKFLFNQAHLCKRWRRDPRRSTGISKRAIKHFRIRNQIAAYAEEGAPRGEPPIRTHSRTIAGKGRGVKDALAEGSELLCLRHQADEVL